MFRHAAASPSWEGDQLALLAAGPGCAASHRAAARMHRLDLPVRSPIELTVPASDLPRQRGCRIHRTNLLEHLDVVQVRSMPVTSVARTLLDLGAVVPVALVEQAAQAAIIERAVGLGDLVSVLERVGGRGRRGTAALRAVVRGSLPDERLESVLEHALHRLLLQLPGPSAVPQFELAVGPSHTVRLDFAWPDRRIAVEADGHRWHATRRDLTRDLQRSRAIQAAGWRHHRFGWSDIRERPDATLAELRRVLNPSGA